MLKKDVRFLLLLALCSTLSSSQYGTVTGVVLDDHGDPLAGAEVHAERNDEPGRRPVKSQFATVLTDSRGRFEYGRLQQGSYDVFAMKEKDGYPNVARFLFYRDGVQPVKATLTASRTLIDVVVTMGRKAGRIASVHVADASTGRPITVTEPTSGKLLQTPYVRFTRSDVNTPSGGPATFSAGSGVLSNLLVPADTPVTITVGATGYANWYYPGTQDPARAQPVRLKSGEDLSFNVLLQPLPEQ